MFKANHNFHMGHLIYIFIPMAELQVNENRCFSIIVLWRKNLNSKQANVVFLVTGLKDLLLSPTAELKGRF